MTRLAHTPEAFMRIWRTLAALVLVLGAAAAASAHHAAAGIDRTKAVELKGPVKAFSWQNPHSWMEVEVASEGKVVTWTIEMTAPSYLVRAGWKATTIKPGDEVRVTVRPLKNGDPGGLFVSLTLADGRTLTERPVVAQPAAAPAAPPAQ
jgi:hypothetical protein